MIYYELVKVTINAFGLTKLTINLVVQYDGLPNAITSH